MYKVIRKSDAQIRKISDSKVAINYVSKDTSPAGSLAVTEGNNCSEKETAECNRIYYVTEGELTLVFSGDETILFAEDSCYVAERTEYEMRGTFKAVVVNQPAFGSR